jgi:DMSO reductase anchor subunit
VSQFSEAFLVLLAQVGIGGLLSLSVPPFQVLGRGFYKSTATVFFVFVVFSLAGRFFLFRHPTGEGSVLGLVMLGVFALSFGVYLLSLWGDHEALVARSYALSFLTGLVSLIVFALDYQPTPLLSFETLIYPLSFLFSALSLGSVISSMLIGHWYLIDPGISIEPFRKLFRFFLIVLVAQVVWEAVTVGGLQLLGSPVSREKLLFLMSEQGHLLWFRVLLAQVGTLVLCFFIWKTLEIPHTMAATGLLYIAVLFVCVGEIMGKWIFSLTSLPL